MVFLKKLSTQQWCFTKSRKQSFAHLSFTDFFNSVSEVLQEDTFAPYLFVTAEITNYERQ